MKKAYGFTLIELMIVVAIIAIIAAIAIPNLLRSRIQTNESAAISNLHTVCAAEVAFHVSHSQFTTTWADLTGATPAYLDDPLFADATNGKQGYVFTFTAGATTQEYALNADPVSQDVTGSRHFFTNASGVVRQNLTAAAAATDSPIGVSQ